jgi:hypothetical protein
MVDGEHYSATEEWRGGVGRFGHGASEVTPVLSLRARQLTLLL